MMSHPSKPNIFDFATSELSQDAFASWLLSWADQQYAETDEALHRTGTDLLAKLFTAAGSLCPKNLEKLDVRRQYKGIDVLLLVNSTHALIIEDKTYTEQHSAQWEEWHRVLAVEAVERGVPLLRPRRRNGTWMTVAVLDGDYRRERDGVLDLSETIPVLRGAEALLESAVARASASM